MDFEMKPDVVVVTDTDTENATRQQIEIQVGPVHVLSILVVLGAAVFAAGLGWWTLAGTADVSERRSSLLAEPGDQAISRPALATAPAARPAAPRQMALPPVRRGFKPAPETGSVKGDPNAPITIVEYSDYQ